MRYELNISLKKDGEKGLPNYKVEVKNIGSISVLKKVIQSEIDRQTKILDEGKTPIQETRGLRGMSGETKSQRVKEDSEDYRYFPEPDIPPIHITKEWLAEIDKRLIELPQERKDRYIAEYNLEPDSAEVLVSGYGRRADFFEACVNVTSKSTMSKEIAKWIIGDLRGLMNQDNVRFADLKVKPTDIVEIVAALEGKRITGTIAKQVLAECFESGKSVESIIKEGNLEVVTDESEIELFADQAIAENQKVVKDISKNPNAIKFLVGQVMRLSKGKANPNVAEEILKKKLL
ncbi:Asp-tRNA(Asn)/Glu-tRNA(Gln) amidotransferase GatCAB subunit B, partial [Candidatus Dojkabacteria bacterium]|nr:Asp-tRNA(Asn)/Glu-tRNA(Gln) amidotransferase GatCAB subunit B [Candidatus Dojkabacteria bacterium]